MKIEENSSQ